MTNCYVLNGLVCSQLDLILHASFISLSTRLHDIFLDFVFKA